MVERKTIRPRKDVYEKLNTDRTEKDLTWDEYLTGLYDGGVDVTVHLAASSTNEVSEAVSNRVVEKLRDELY